MGSIMSNFDFDWSDLAFGSKKPLKELKATFIAASREISEARFKQLLKEYLVKSHVVLGLAKEDYIAGFEDQPQFRTLQQKQIEKIIKTVNANSPHKVYLLRYFQRETTAILEKVLFKKVIFINGSWQYAFHTLPIYYQLVNTQTPFQLVSAFVDEAEARRYEARVNKLLQKQTGFIKTRSYSEAEVLELVNTVAQASFDHCFQTGAVLAKKFGRGYRILLTAHNKIVPYETYALLNGASRELNFSPPNDLNHYDAVHAETELLLRAVASKADIKNTTLFINLLPCPTCARTVADSEIAEVVYQNDHSDGYAVKLLEKAKKTVRRMVV